MNKNIFLYILVAIAVVSSVTFSLFAVVVEQAEQKLIVRIGKPVRVYTDPGLHYKIPFVESEITFSKKILELDASPSETITADKKTLLVDYYAMWYIDDPMKFYLAVRDINGASRRLDDIIYSEMLVQLSKHDLIDIIDKERRSVMDNVTELARGKAEDFGIHITDIRIKRADLPTQNERAVFARMITERQRIAKQYRSEGREAAQKIRATTDREAVEITSNAYKEFQNIRGKADAKAIKVYADSYGKAPEFFEFFKTLEIYENSITEGTNLYLTTDSEILNLIGNSSK